MSVSVNPVTIAKEVAPIVEAVEKKVMSYIPKVATLGDEFKAVTQKFSLSPVLTKEEQKEFAQLFAKKSLELENKASTSKNDFFTGLINKLSEKLSNLTYGLEQTPTFIAKDKSGKVIGGFNYALEDFASLETRNIHIRSLVTDSSELNVNEKKELLTQMCQKIKFIANKNDVKTITCDISKDNQSLVRLYKMMGFAEESGTKNSVARLKVSTEEFAKNM